MKGSQLPPCVYIIRNAINDHTYVGATKRYAARIREHKSRLKKKRHSSRLLQEFYEKNGIDVFSFHILEVCKEEEMDQKEQYYCDIYKPAFNIRVIVNSNAGIKRTEETRIRTSIASTGRKWTEEQKKKMIGHKPMLGKTHSNDVRAKISANRKGKHAGTDNVFSRFTKEDIIKIRYDFQNGVSSNKLARSHSVAKSTILRIVNKTTYSNIS